MRAAFAIVAVLAASTGCGSDESTLDRDAAVAASVDVRTSGCGPRLGFGTGSLVADRLIVTAAHVVAGTTEVVTIDVEGTQREAQVVLFDPDLDLAVLRSATSHPQVPVALRVDEAQAGETGMVALPRLTDEGTVVDVVDITIERRANIKTTDIYRADEVTRSGFEIVGPIDPGDSGALVVLAGGGVGIVWARSNLNADRAWAIDLPAAVTGAEAHRALMVAEPVDVGECVPQ